MKAIKDTCRDCDGAGGNHDGNSWEGLDLGATCARCKGKGWVHLLASRLLKRVATRNSFLRVVGAESSFRDGVIHVAPVRHRFPLLSVVRFAPGLVTFAPAAPVSAYAGEF